MPKFKRLLSLIYQRCDRCDRYFHKTNLNNLVIDTRYIKNSFLKKPSHWSHWSQMPVYQGFGELKLVTSVAHVPKVTNNK